MGWVLGRGVYNRLKIGEFPFLLQATYARLLEAFNDSYHSKLKAINQTLTSNYLWTRKTK